MLKIRFAAILAAGLLACAAPLHAQTAPASAPAAFKSDPVADDFFNRGVIPEIRISLNEAQIKTLTDKPREYIDVVVKENADTTYENIKLKVKGAIGSTRAITDRPALTLKMTKKGERFHGLDKFHLNNSVQDTVYLNELICSQLAFEAGLPAARTTHARVWINDRDLGLYVLKEGFDEHLLARFFTNNKGNLYQAQYGQDIDFALERDEGKGPDDKKDLAALLAACRETDREKRYKLIEEVLDLDQFITFTAMELMMGHWDGYSGNCNNYRIYFRPDDKRAVFILHGMDQMFRDKNATIFEFPRRILTRAIFDNPAWYEKYRARVKELLPLFDPEKLAAKLAAGYERVRPAIAKIGEAEVTAYDERYKLYKTTVVARQRTLMNQFPPGPIEFDKNGVYTLGRWEPINSAAAKLERTKGENGQSLLVIACLPESPRAEALFRTKIRIARGHYIFEAKVKTNGVVPIDDKKAQGAGVRLFDTANRQNGVYGTSIDWETVSIPFEVTQERDMPLFLELRAIAGSATFDAASTIIRKAAPATAPSSAPAK